MSESGKIPVIHKINLEKKTVSGNIEKELERILFKII